ncbi:MAG: beta-ketoacyl synthase [Bacteroidia bacterium]|nr:beta-ketoacyl synthase [Bacteroidia bacterium]
MKNIFVLGSNILSPLGETTEENFSRLYAGDSGVQFHRQANIHDTSFWASIFSEEQVLSFSSKSSTPLNFTKFEQMLIASVTDALKNSKVDPSGNETIFICSTTKGSITELENSTVDKIDTHQLELFQAAKKLSAYFKNQNEPVVVSNACISGLAAVIVAKRFLSAGLYENAIVVGADTISRFVYSGFYSFQALSPQQCKPFSTDREGINLGEAAATMILSIHPNKKSSEPEIRVLGGSMSNDANHISGPSRTGEELGIAINKSIAESKLFPADIDLISAHGTATLYNDEMEAKAINFAKLENVPVNSLKGYFGHTLGAAGLLESIISIESMKRNVVLSTAGFSKAGIEPAVNVCRETTEKEINYCLKIASGFGGCNAAVVYSKK